MDDPRAIFGEEKIEYIYECEFPEIQELWEPAVGDDVFDKLENKVFAIKAHNLDTIPVLCQSGRLVFLPSINWLVEKMVGMHPERTLDKNQMIEGVLSPFYWARDKSPRIALIKELKIILKDKRNREKNLLGNSE